MSSASRRLSRAKTIRGCVDEFVGSTERRYWYRMANRIERRESVRLAINEWQDELARERLEQEIEEQCLYYCDDYDYDYDYDVEPYGVESDYSEDSYDFGYDHRYDYDYDCYE